MIYHRELTEEEKAFKEITEYPIVLDFSLCNNKYRIHNLLKDKFGFPAYYGENWDAFWDCINGLFYDEGEVIVEIHNFSSLSDREKNYCKPMFEIFEDVHKDTPNVIFKFIS